MAKNKKKKSEKKRNLKYGNVTLPRAEVAKGSSNSFDIQKKDSVSRKNNEFKKEIRKNLIFIGSFFAFLLILYILITKTNVLNPLLDLLGLGGLYQQ